MNLNTLERLRRLGIVSLMLVLAGAPTIAGTKDQIIPASATARQQLSIGYSLLYAEATGIPKLDWLLKLKSKSADMTQATGVLMQYYKGLSERMENLANQYPAVHLDAKTMSDIEAEARKSLGVDQAKNFAPLAGNTGVPLEREALITFRSALDEQRHLVGVMIDKETSLPLRKFLETTHQELEEHFKQINLLLEKRYFTH